jgi:asparagine synthase (glutamine-hydrolysing)
VALSGLGADELFGGYVTFDETRRLRRVLAPSRLLPSGLRRGLMPLLTAGLSVRRRRRVRELLGLGGSILDIALHVHRIHDDATLESLGLNRERLGLTDHWLPAEAYEPLVDVSHDIFRAVSQVSLFMYMGNTLLRDTDISSMACSVETRVPFLGRRVVEAVGAMPGKTHSPHGSPRKRLLRAAARRFLPNEVIDRPKRGFHLPLQRWMDGPVREQCEDSLHAAAACPFLNSQGVRDAWEAAGAAGALAQPRRLAIVALGSYLQRMSRTNKSPAVANALLTT